MAQATYQSPSRVGNNNICCDGTGLSLVSDALMNNVEISVGRIQKELGLMRFVSMNETLTCRASSLGIGDYNMREVPCGETKFRPEPHSAQARTAQLGEFDVATMLHDNYLCPSGLNTRENVVRFVSQIIRKIESSAYRKIESEIYSAIERKVVVESLGECGCDGDVNTITAEADGMVTVDASAGLTADLMGSVGVAMSELNVVGEDMVVMLPMASIEAWKKDVRSQPGGLTYEEEQLGTRVRSINGFNVYTPYDQRTFFKKRNINGKDVIVTYAFSAESLTLGYKLMQIGSPLLGASLTTDRYGIVQMQSGNLTFTEKNGIHVSAVMKIRAIRNVYPAIVRILLPADTLGSSLIKTKRTSNGIKSN